MFSPAGRRSWGGGIGVEMTERKGMSLVVKLWKVKGHTVLHGVKIGRLDLTEILKRNLCFAYYGIMNISHPLHN